MTEENKTSKNIFTSERTLKYFLVSLIGTAIAGMII